jgi:hypothetical protein
VGIVLIDCDTCEIRGDACGDCVVTVMLGATRTLDPEERSAIAVLASVGLVPPLRLVPGGPGEAPSASGPASVEPVDNRVTRVS